MYRWCDRQRPFWLKGREKEARLLQGTELKWRVGMAVGEELGTLEAWGFKPDLVYGCGEEGVTWRDP